MAEVDFDIREEDMIEEVEEPITRSAPAGKNSKRQKGMILSYDVLPTFSDHLAMRSLKHQSEALASDANALRTKIIITS